MRFGRFYIIISSLCPFPFHGYTYTKINLKFRGIRKSIHGKSYLYIVGILYALRQYEVIKDSEILAIPDSYPPLPMCPPFAPWQTSYWVNRWWAGRQPLRSDVVMGRKRQDSTPPSPHHTDPLLLAYILFYPCTPHPGVSVFPATCDQKYGDCLW